MFGLADFRLSDILSHIGLIWLLHTSSGAGLEYGSMLCTVMCDTLHSMIQYCKPSSWSVPTTSCFYSILLYKHATTVHINSALSCYITVKHILHTIKPCYCATTCTAVQLEYYGNTVYWCLDILPHPTTVLKILLYFYGIILYVLYIYLISGTFFTAYLEKHSLIEDMYTYN